MLDNYEFLLRKREEFAHEPIIPPPLVRGEDLIALGMKPGPKFGEILEAVETRQLEGAVRDRAEALEWVKREYFSGILVPLTWKSFLNTYLRQGFEDLNQSLKNVAERSTGP